MTATIEIPKSVLTKSQKKKFGPVVYTEGNQTFRITATACYNDQCGNGHNSFGLTADIDIKYNGRWEDHAGGWCHDEIARYFPELAPLIKWHLTSSDGPMHYKANTLYWLGYSGYCDGKHNSPPNLEHARSTAVWPDMPQTFLCQYTEGGWSYETTKDKVVSALMERLPGLMAEFKTAMESLGFVY